VADGCGGKLLEARGKAWELYVQWRHRGLDPAATWRSWRLLPQPAVEPFPYRIEAFLRACAMYAERQALHTERMSKIADAWVESQSSRPSTGGR
jgi:hypothetical protein